jgi:hypothetical protein
MFRPKGNARPAFLHDDLMTEYYRITDIVAKFDERLTTIKSWGVTASLAALVLGFQLQHYGIFLIAAAGAASFWVIEGTVKRQQRAYYPRMGDIEVIAYELWREETPSGPASSPLIDWGFYTAWPRLKGGKSKGSPRTPHAWKDVNDKRGMPTWLYAHVAFPHVIVMVLGVTLFVLGVFGAWPIEDMPV